MYRPLLALLATALAVTFALPAFGQGCIIARGGGNALIPGGGGFPEPGEWEVNVAYRTFHSDRHFLGSEEQAHRQAQGTQVDNWSHFIDLNASYALNRRTSLNLTVPFVVHERSSLYEHENFGRFTTRSRGLGDIRIGADTWIWNPESAFRGNLSVGIDLKIPTGEYRATDTFRTADGGTIIRAVDTSIQPGDGGWGVGLDFQGFLHLQGGLTGYANGAYLINPRESTSQLNPRQRPTYGNLYSVPDSYLFRMGLDYALIPTEGLNISLGGRLEGVPQKDLIGGNQGRRRPGYAFSIEPGLTWSKGRFSASLTTPVAVARNRKPDFGRLDGHEAEGDAAFADYTINLAVSARF